MHIQTDVANNLQIGRLLNSIHATRIIILFFVFKASLKTTRKF